MMKYRSCFANWRKYLVLFFLAGTLQASEPRFWVGVCTHLGKGKGDTAASVALMKGMGIRSLRDELSWSAVERQKGVMAVPSQFDDLINQAVKGGIQPLLILDYGNHFYDNGDKPLSDDANYSSLSLFFLSKLIQKIPPPRLLF